MKKILSIKSNISSIKIMIISKQTMFLDFSRKFLFCLDIKGLEFLENEKRKLVTCSFRESLLSFRLCCCNLSNHPRALDQ